MKIEKINIFGYGKLVNKTYDFHQLQIIYGLNESGKSTIISFIKSMLFGFLDNRSNEGHFKPKSGDRFGGQLILKFNGHDYLIERLYGPNGGNAKIMDFDSGEELGEDFLFEILGPINRQNFDSLFYFGDLNLSEIKKMSEKELIQRIQRIGVVGINDWLKINDQFENTAKDIYKPTGKKDELHPLFQELDQLNSKLKETENDYSKYLDLKNNIKASEKKSNDIQIKIKKIKNDLDLMNNDLNQWDNYQLMTDLNQQNLTLREGFKSDDYDLITKIVEQKRQIDNQIEELNHQINTLQNNGEKTHSDNFYFENSNKIQALSEQNNEINYKNEQLKNYYDQKKQLEEKKDKLDEKNISRIKLMNKSEIKYLSDLLQKSDSKNDNSRFFISFGLLVLSVFIFLSGLIIFKHLMLFLSLISILLFFGSCYFIYKVKISGKNELNQLGIDYSMQNFPTYRWIELQSKANQFNELNNEEVEINQKIKNLSADIDNYIFQWKFAKNYIDLNSDVQNILTNIEQFITSTKDIDRNNNDKKLKLDNYHEILDSLYFDQKGVSQEINEFFKIREITSLDEFMQKYHEQGEIRSKVNKQNELKKSFDDSKVSRFIEYSSKDNLEDMIKQAKGKLDNLDNEITRLNSNYANDQAYISNIVKNGLYSEIKQKITNQEDEIKSVIKRWLVYKLSSYWIDKALFNATKGRIPMVQADAQKYFSFLTNGKYDKITYQKTKLKVIDSNKNTFDVQELSKGTMIQLYLSLIFALTIAFSDEYPFPLIIDDGFVDFDKLRTKNAFKVLKDISNRTQVLYFTANDEGVNNENYAQLKLN